MFHHQLKFFIHSAKNLQYILHIIHIKVMCPCKFSCACTLLKYADKMLTKSLEQRTVIRHICRAENTALIKILLFAKPERKYCRDLWGKISGLLGVSSY